MISFLLAVFSYVSSEFIFQRDHICKNSLNYNWINRGKTNIKCSLISGGVVALIFLTFYSAATDILIFSMDMILLRFLMDSIDSFICKNIKNEWTSFITFFIKQLIYLIAIFFIWTRFNFKINWISLQIKNLSNVYILNHYGIGNIKNTVANILIFLIIFIYVSLGGDVIIRNLMFALRVLRGAVVDENEAYTSFPMYKVNGQSQQNQSITQTAATKEKINEQRGSKKKKKKNDSKKEKTPKVLNSEVGEGTLKEASIEQVTVTAAKEEECNKERVKKDGKGKYIGILERIIIMILTINNSFTSIAFVLTAKSIVRSKRIESEPGFAEEYLIGTLTSILIAILGGCAFILLHIQGK